MLFLSLQTAVELEEVIGPDSYALSGMPIAVPPNACLAMKYNCSSSAMHV